MENKNVQILSIEGKDLITKKYEVNKNSIYKASLDDAMEVDELKRLNKKIISYNKNKKRFYSDDIMTVTFKYACKQERDLTDEEYERVQSLELTLRLLNDKVIIKETKELLQIAKRNINKKSIREQIYRYGFNIYINGKLKHFVRYKRSSGSARAGKCLFINEKYYKHMIDWSFAGIPHEEDIEMDCASTESYIALPTSSCVDRFRLRPENILLIEDGKSTFNNKVMATRFINEEKDEDGNVINGDLDTNVEEAEITNKIWDGENLLDRSIFETKGYMQGMIIRNPLFKNVFKRYKDKAILQVRNRMFKGIGVNTDIQQFFKDNGITDISQLNGQTIATDIKQIKLITTPSSVKYLKYGTFDNWLKQIILEWGICKYEKPQHHFNGMVQTHYQLINSLGMNKETTYDFLKDTINYINLLKTDTAVFKYHLGLTGENNKEELSNNIQTNSDFILNMLEINDDFINTKICKNFRNEVVKSYTNNARHGHILVEGNYSIVVSSPLEFLKASIGQWKGETLIQPNECVSSKFEVGEDVLGVRSPQPTMCNMNVFKNTKYKELDKYFNTKSQEVIYISAIGWNIFELESSMDVDGDSMMLTNNKYITESGKNLLEKIVINKKEIDRFLVSTDFTPKLSINRKYNWKDLADTDIKCSSNKIGEIINLAQMLNSVYWDKKFKGASEEYLFSLYKDIFQLNILSCIEIDRCKKLSPVDAKKELDKIRRKGYLSRGNITREKEKKEVGIRPYFFKFLDGGKDYKFKKFHTGMDYLEEVLDDYVKRKDENSYDVPLVDVLEKQKINKQDNKIIDKIKKKSKELKYHQAKIWNSECENKWELNKDLHDSILNDIKKIQIYPSTIYTILLRIHKSFTSNKYDEYKQIGKRIMTLLYESNKFEFIKCIKINTKNKSFIIETDDGNINLYGINFEKIG